MAPVTYNIYRNHKLWKRGIKKNASTGATSITEIYDVLKEDETFVCYSVESIFEGFKNSSLPSKELCFYQIGPYYLSSELENLSSIDNNISPIFEHGKLHFRNWGNPEDKLTGEVLVENSGWYEVDIEYSNSFNNITTGITASVKKITFLDLKNGKEASQIVCMPHRSGWDNWGYSTPGRFYLEGNKVYSVTIKDYFNMSYLEHFKNYIHVGGSAPVNRANISTTRIQHTFSF